MANTSRRYIDKNGNMFIPMNVEGGGAEEHFIGTGKMVLIILMIASYIITFAYLADAGARFTAYVVYFLLLTFINQFILRYFVLEEKYFYDMYKKMKVQEITTPASFWDIASIKQTPEGDILTYSDAKIAVIVKLDRDTIIGKPEDFKENHYDALSDFYRELVNSKLSFVQMNIMEPAGNDPRIQSLDRLVLKSSNPNICKLMEREIGYTKNITRTTLYESDYFLIYTNDLTRVDYLIQDTIDALYVLLDGGYVGYRILNSKDIIELVKKLNGVKYFNYTEATLEMYNLNGIRSERPFSITGLVFNDGEKVDFDAKAKNKIYSMTSEILGGTLNIKDVSIRETVDKKENKDFKGVDIDDISKGYSPNEPLTSQTFQKPNSGRFGTPNIGKNRSVQNIGSRQDMSQDYSEQGQTQTKPSMNDFDTQFDDDNIVDF